jgi:hypothetical protein
MLTATAQPTRRYSTNSTVTPQKRKHSTIGEDVDGVTTWKRESELPAPPVHYGMYVDPHCDDAPRAEHFFIGGFKSLCEANHAVKRSAGMSMSKHTGARIFDKRMDVLGEKGEVIQR